MRNGLPDLEIGEDLVAVVDLDDQLVGQRLVALGHHFEFAVGGNAIQIRQRHLRKGGKLNFARLKCGGCPCPVRQYPEDHFVKLRLAFAPVILVAGETVVFAGLVLGEDEGTGAHGFIVGRVVGDVRALIQMLGQDTADHRKCIADQLQRGRLGELENGRQFVGCFHRFEVGKHRAPDILKRLPDLHRREGDVS